jgi:hypothetical protein
MRMSHAAFVARVLKLYVGGGIPRLPWVVLDLVHGGVDAEVPRRCPSES